MNRIYLVAAFLLLGAVSGFARKKHDTPGTGNPVIPGYFADPTIKKFGDTYYMYATTDAVVRDSDRPRCGRARYFETGR